MSKMSIANRNPTISPYVSSFAFQPGFSSLRDFWVMSSKKASQVTPQNGKKKIQVRPSIRIGWKHNHRFLTCVKTLRKCVSLFRNSLANSRFTLQGINISPKNGILKMIFLFPRWDMLVPWRVSFIFLLKVSIFWSEVGKIESEAETIFTLPRSLTVPPWKLTETQKGSRIVCKNHHFSGATVSVVTKEFSVWNSRNWKPTYQNDGLSTLKAFFEKQCILYACTYIYEISSPFINLYIQNNALWWKDRWRSPLPKGGESFLGCLS